MSMLSNPNDPTVTALVTALDKYHAALDMLASRKVSEAAPDGCVVRIGRVDVNIRSGNNGGLNLMPPPANR